MRNPRNASPWFLAASIALLSPAAVAADVTGRVETHTAPRSRASQAIVYAEPVDRPAPARPATPRLVQRDKTFIPAVMVVPVGSTVDFPNQDDIFHNVFSLSAPAPFDLGLYRAGATKKRTFAQPGSLSGLLQHPPPNDRLHRRRAHAVRGTRW